MADYCIDMSRLQHGRKVMKERLYLISTWVQGSLRDTFTKKGN